MKEVVQGSETVQVEHKPRIKGAGDHVAPKRIVKVTRSQPEEVDLEAFTRAAWKVLGKNFGLGNAEQTRAYYENNPEQLPIHLSLCHTLAFMVDESRPWIVRKTNAIANNTVGRLGLITVGSICAVMAGKVGVGWWQDYQASKGEI